MQYLNSLFFFGISGSAKDQQFTAGTAVQAGHLPVSSVEHPQYFEQCCGTFFSTPLTSRKV